MAATNFSDLITFSRGSNATLTGPTGLVQWAPMNLLTNSESFDASAWNKVNATISANAVAAPDGATTADNLVEDATTGSHYAQQFVSYVAGLSYTFSAYIKAGIRSWVEVDFPSAAFGTAQGGYFNLTGSGSLGNATGSPTARTITAVGNGWYRVSITATATATAGGNTLIIAASANGTTSYAGSNGSTALSLWGAQLELGTTATTYNNTSVKNLLGFSEAFDNAAWTKTRASMVTGAAANPLNGLFTAQKLMEDTTASNSHAVYRSVTITAAPHTLSIYAKAAGRNWFYLVCTTAANAGAYFNLATGEIGTVSSGYTAAITSVGNGWYRCSITFTGTAATWYPNVYLANADNSSSYTGDGNSGIYIYGAQLSNSASLDPYVPTPGAAPSSAAYYGPRFDYDPVTLQPKGLLVEEQRTNLLLQSQFASGWSTNAATTTFSGTNVTAPDGTLTGRTVNDTSTSVAAYVFQGVSFTSGTTYAMSVYVKKGATNFFTITSFTQSGRAIFNLNTNAVASVTGIVASATITNVGNGWYRCTAIMTATATASNNVGYGDFEIAPSGDLFSVWGAQLEAGAFATSYIPTVASTVTRSADVATITGQNFSQWYGPTAGTIVVGWDSSNPITVNTSIVASANDGTNNNYIEPYQYQALTAGSIYVGGVLQADIARTTPAVVPETVYLAALAFTANDAQYARNGSLGTQDTALTLPTVDRMSIGSRASARFINGHIRSIRYFPVRAADFQLQQVTS